MEEPLFPPQFHPIVTAWFQRRFGEPSPPQRLGWPLIAARKHTLILAPTGSGKTLAAFLACLDALVWELLAAEGSGVRGQGVEGEGSGARGQGIARPELTPAPRPLPPGAQRLTPAAGVRILYVSPLKALNYDIEKNLREPLAGLAEEAERQGFALPEIRVGVRTGDTRSKGRQQMLRRPPHILITTPESLHLMLTSQAQSMLGNVQFLILDEIHALCNNKRGVFTSLLLERLEEVVRTAGREQGAERQGLGVRGQGSGTTPNSSILTPDPSPLTPAFVRIGLSATQRPLEEVARFLGGAVWEGDRLTPRPVEIVDAGMRKQLSLQVLCPVEDLAHMEAQTLWPGITRRLLGLIEHRKSTLIFANNRRQVERLTAQLNEGAREEIALPHHGSIAAPVRKITEQRLKQGEVRAVCATGTLELGIDMGAIELVCQVESPRQVSKGLQRVGRAGHLMSAVSEGRILAKQPLDLLEAAVLAREMLAGRVESLHVPRNCLDVLAQQLVAIVADGERSLADLYRLVRQSYCFRDLPEAQFQGTVAMISGRYPSHLFRDLRARVALDRVRQRLLPLPGTRRAALTNGGTIPDTGQFGVYLSDRRVKLGELDEEFIYESRVGDSFSLGIDTWRIDRIEADRVLVSPAPGAPARMPFWRGESYGREPELGQALGEFVAAVGDRLHDPELEAWIRAEVPVDAVGARNIAAYLRDGQEKCGALPTHRTLLVESFEDEIGERRLAILSPLGRRVHLTLRLALAALIKERFGVDPEALHNDDGLLLRLPGGETELPLDLLHQVPPEAVWELVVRQLGSSPLFGLRFRQNAARALLLPGARPGKRTPLWLQRLKAKDLLSVAAGYDDFPIVLETYRECLEEFLAVDAARALLEGLRDGTVTAVAVRRDTPSPFVASLLFDFQAAYMYEWDRPKTLGRGENAARERLVADLVGHLRSTPSLLDPNTLAEREARLQGTARDARARTPAEFLELLRRLGDLPADGDAVAARYMGDAPAMLRALCADRLLVQIPLPGAAQPWHWILTEEWPLYRDAFLSGVQAFRRSGIQAVGNEAVEGAGMFPPSRSGLGSSLVVRGAEDREMALEEAVPAIFREPASDRGEDEAAHDAARQTIIRRFTLHRMLTTTAEVAATYGLAIEEAEAILRELETVGALVSLSQPGDDPASSLIPPSASLAWASPEHLEDAYIATLARRRREARPASIAQYQRFLLAWQHRTGPPLTGEEGLRQVLAQLQGLPLPSPVWEGEVLARRVRPYQSGWLDHVCESGEFVWQGGGTTAWSGAGPRDGNFSGRGRIAFFHRELFPFWPSPRDEDRRLRDESEAGPSSSSSPRASSLTERVAQVLQQRGASFLIDLALATGIDSRDVAVALWELIWRGLVTHDQWGVLRAGPPAGRPPVSTERPAVPGRGAPGARWPRPSFSRRGVSTPAGHERSGGGRYSWLPALQIGPAEPSGSGHLEAADLVARQMLERYGIVARELLELESVPLPWGALYDALTVMELTGEIQRGYFVEGFSGAQFGLPRACDELKALQERRMPAAPEFTLVNACDPANLYGGAVRRSSREEETGGGGEGETGRENDQTAEPRPGTPRREGDGSGNWAIGRQGEQEHDYEHGHEHEHDPNTNDRTPNAGHGHAVSPRPPLAPSSPRPLAPPRLPSNYLVLRNGEPALLLECGARRLTPLLPLEGEELAAACAALRDLTEHRWPLRPVRQLRIERWGERPIRGSEAEAPLRAIGFSVSPKGLEL